MSAVPRVAFFSDSFHEINGVALTSGQLDSFARRKAYPFLTIHAGPATRRLTENTVTSIELQRSPIGFAVDADLSFDLAFLRYRHFVRRELLAFRPDVVHVTSPGDCGILGAILAWELRVPLIASWHTNIHQFGARRLEKLLGFLPGGVRRALAAGAERRSLDCALRFYRLARVLLAPNQELVGLLKRRTGRPAFLMRRGVDTVQFSPRKRDSGDRPFTLGYVGRLTAEKNVRFLAHLEQSLLAAGLNDFRFLLVGQGSEQEWLRTHLHHADFAGVLQGEALARAYANMDLFVFPSHTDTFGNVVQEAFASGVPVVVTNSGGPKFVVEDGVTGFVASDDQAFIHWVRTLMLERELRGRMKLAAREYALAASWDAVFDDVYRAYTYCINLVSPRDVRSLQQTSPSWRVT